MIKLENKRNHKESKAATREMFDNGLLQTKMDQSFQDSLENQGHRENRYQK